MKRAHGLNVDAKSNLFRNLTGKEEEAVTIMDNRNIFDRNVTPNNDVLIVCDHASEDLKFLKTLEKEDGLIRSNEGLDVGAADMACALSERLECMSVLTNFSKLIIDPSVPISNQHLVKQFYHQLQEDGTL